MNKKQIRRAEVLKQLSAGRITKSDAQKLLGLSLRQINRIIRDFEDNGLHSLIHGNTGRNPVNKTEDYVSQLIISLADKDGKYHGLNTCHLQDMLLENENIAIGHATLYRLLRDQNIIKPGRSKGSARRMRRERSASEGMLLQIDGSSHDWLSGRGPKMTLIGAIDDATGKIAHLIFRPTEDQAGYLMMMRSISKDYGLPECFYHDKHTILRSPKEATLEDELADRLPQSQLQRIMSELGIVSIPANSPQAKGRIERLWNTLQDRLIKEMTIAGITNISDANAFLPGFIARFNARFGKAPANPDSAWVEIDSDMDIPYYFSTSESRVVRRDHTIAWQGKILQILPDQNMPHLPGKRVDVHVVPEGDIYLYLGKLRLKHKQILTRPAQPAVDKQVLSQEKSAKSSSGRRAWLFAKPAA